MRFKNFSLPFLAATYAYYNHSDYLFLLTKYPKILVLFPAGFWPR